MALELPSLVIALRYWLKPSRVKNVTTYGLGNGSDAEINGFVKYGNFAQILILWISTKLNLRIQRKNEQV